MPIRTQAAEFVLAWHIIGTTPRTLLTYFSTIVSQIVDTKVPTLYDEESWDILLTYP